MNIEKDIPRTPFSVEVKINMAGMEEINRVKEKKKKKLKEEISSEEKLEREKNAFIRMAAKELADKSDKKEKEIAKKKQGNISDVWIAE